jgi:flagellar hook-basal body complex protein FliE
MADPLGLIGGFNSVQRLAPLAPSRAGGDEGTVGGPQPEFKKFLQEQIAQVNELQNDATVAVEDLAAGRRDDLEGVIIATQKADVAFKMLLQVRNKVMEAYDEIKQIRV